MDIRIAVCDDNFIFVNEVKQICEEYFASKNENCHVECFSCGEEVLHAVDLAWDVLFLDIEMGKISGIEVKDQLLENNCETQIVFLTSHNECMKEAFGRNVVGFIEKKNITDELSVILKKIYRDILRGERIWSVKGNRIVLDDIYYIHAEGSYVIVITKEERLLIRESLSECEKQLETKGFMRVHRSVLIHLKYVSGVTESYVEIGNREKLRISRGMCRKIKAKYMEYIR